MSKSYGMMCSFDKAIEWAERQQASTMKDCAINRMMYQRDLAIPVEPKFIKGRYGHQYDSHSCGNCGFTVDVIYKFCPSCGRAILWR